MKTITRFAPSPTGRIHLGNIRTALYNYLFTKKHNGTFILRIEDTDKTRSKPEYTQGIFEDLAWLGIQPDHSCQQSQQQHTYHTAIETLLHNQNAYHCTCTQERLAELKKEQIQNKRPPRYDKHCQNQKHHASETSVIRFNVPSTNTSIQTQSTTFRTKDIEDFVIQRSDGSPTFLLSNACDDIQMNVSCIIRGQDHIANTPKQILLFQALGAPVPIYQHIPLVLNENGSPLSKRQNDVHIQSLRQEGYTPEAINNYLIRLGHTTTHNNLMDMTQMIDAFDLNNLSQSPAKFNLKQLQFWQKKHIQSLPNEDFLKYLSQASANWHKPPSQWAHIVQENILTFKDAIQWQNALFSTHYQYTDAQLKTLQEAGQPFFHTLREHLAQHSYNPHSFEWLVALAKTHTGKKGKQLFMPIRLMLTRATHGPDLDQFAPLFDMPTVLQRIEHCLSQLP